MLTKLLLSSFMWLPTAIKLCNSLSSRYERSYIAFVMNCVCVTYHCLSQTVLIGAMVQTTDGTCLYTSKQNMHVHISYEVEYRVLVSQLPAVM